MSRFSAAVSIIVLCLVVIVGYSAYSKRGTAGQLMLPEFVKVDSKSFRFESEIGQVVMSPPENELDQLIHQLDGVSNSFASVTRDDGTYIQCGGGPREFTVELRIVGKKTGFQHFKAKQPSVDGVPRQLTIGGQSVSVRSDQIFDVNGVCRLFLAFVRGQLREEPTDWENITGMFAP